MKVELIAYTPNPDGVANLGAGTCVSEDIPVIETSVNGKKALKHALGSGHESVIEHCSFTFAVSGVSRALTHQLVRHRVASYSQQSQRYVKMDGFKYVTPRSISKCITDETMVAYRGTGETVDFAYWDLMREIKALYTELVKAGIPEEDARYILPNACCTNIIVTMNARELRHFFALRCCNRAQWEIRELANKMLELVKPIAPMIFENAGASCVMTGRCPEGKKSCGRWKE